MLITFQVRDKRISIYPPLTFFVKLTLYNESVTYRIRFLSGGGIGLYFAVIYDN